MTEEKEREVTEIMVEQVISVEGSQQPVVKREEPRFIALHHDEFPTPFGVETPSAELIEIVDLNGIKTTQPGVHFLDVEVQRPVSSKPTDSLNFILGGE